MGQKTVNIGILTVNGPEFHPNGRLGEAARAMGHAVQLINPYTLVCEVTDGSPAMTASRFESMPDIILPRQGSPMGEYGFVLLRQLRDMGIPLVNGVAGITVARNQYITLQTLAAANIPVPDSCFVTREEGFYRAVQRMGGYPVVAKQVSGMGGDGVARIDDDAMAKDFLERRLEETRGLVVQAFLPPRGRMDLRMLVIGNEVAGTMKLTPAKNDFRSNINRSGTAQAFEPPADWQDTAISAARACSLDIAGIDMIVEKDGRPLVVEVNYSPGFKGLEAATGRDIARKIIDYTVGVSEHHCAITKH